MSIRWEVNLGFDKIKANVQAAAGRAVETGMSHLKSVVTPLVPFETGALAGSGDVGAGRVDGVGPGGEHVAHLYYPGPYALYQHEGVFYRHGRTGAPLTHTHGQSFFLLQPAVTHSEEVVEAAGEVVKAAMHR